MSREMLHYFFCFYGFLWVRRILLCATPGDGRPGRSADVLCTRVTMTAVASAILLLPMTTLIDCYHYFYYHTTLAQLSDRTSSNGVHAGLARRIAYRANPAPDGRDAAWTDTQEYAADPQKSIKTKKTKRLQPMW